MRPETAKPLIVKLTPNATDPGAVAAAAESAGADAVSLVNTLKGMALHPETGEPWLGGRTGGLSGPAIRAIALEQVAAVASRVEIPVIGMGGIASGRQAADFMAAGASAVAVGTESFRDPAAGRRIAAELAELSLSGRVGTTAATTATEPVWGTRARSFCGRCGNFPPLAGKSANLLTKIPANKRKTLKDPQPT